MSVIIDSANVSIDCILWSPDKSSVQRFYDYEELAPRTNSLPSKVKGKFPYCILIKDCDHNDLDLIRELLDEDKGTAETFIISFGWNYPSGISVDDLLREALAHITTVPRKRQQGLIYPDVSRVRSDTDKVYFDYTNQDFCSSVEVDREANSFSISFKIQGFTKVQRYFGTKCVDLKSDVIKGMLAEHLRFVDLGPLKFAANAWLGRPKGRSSDCRITDDLTGEKVNLTEQRAKLIEETCSISLGGSDSVVVAQSVIDNIPNVSKNRRFKKISIDEALPTLKSICKAHRA